MIGRTHLATGLVTGITIVTYTNMVDSDYRIIFSAACAIGTLLPDIDTEDSTIGRLFFPIAKVVNKVFGHRQLFHSPVFLLGFALFLGSVYFFSKGWGMAGSLGIILGYTIHLLEDFFADKGIPLLYPLKKKKYGIRLVKTGGVVDNALCIVCWITILYFGGYSLSRF